MGKRALRLLIAVWIGLSCASAMAQSYPNRPIRLLLGFPTGSATDFIARLLAPKMTEGLGQPVVVENRPGASGIIAAAAVAKSPPDGYTILVTTPGIITTARALFKDRLQYSPETDFEPVGLIGVSPLLLVVKGDSTLRTVADVVALAAATPSGLNVASYGVGSPSHFTVEMLRVQSRLPITHVAHNGSAALETALLGGIVPAAIDSVTAAMPLLAAGRMRALAITAPERLATLPDVPTMEEAGLGPVELGGWAGLHLPKGTPVEIVQRLNDEMNRVIALPDIREQMGDRLVIVGGSPGAFTEHITRERARLTKLIEDANLTFQ